jgi:hypothetical protein
MTPGVFAQALVAAMGLMAADRARLAQEIETLRLQLSEKVALLLEPADEDRRAWAEFLRQPDTGLIRLLPEERYRDKLALRGDGAYYSFARLTHEYGQGSDLALRDGAFHSGFAGYQTGLLVRLGDLPLERATLEHPAIRFLAAFQPAQREPEIRARQRELSRPGLEHEGFTYRREVKVEPDTTYALRSIDYDRSDVIVAFRVGRRDADGSVILPWRKLATLPAPRAARPDAAGTPTAKNPAAH